MRILIKAVILHENSNENIDFTKQISKRGQKNRQKFCSKKNQFFEKKINFIEQKKVIFDERIKTGTVFKKSILLENFKEREM